MPAQKRPKPLYQRGKFALYRREGRTNLEIVWYDGQRKRERSTSAGTADCGEARLVLDRMYLADAGSRVCPTCNRPWDRDGSPLLATVIGDYLLTSEGKAGHKSARTRLGHVLDYLAATDATLKCVAVDGAWADAFRKWMAGRTYRGAAYSLSHVEGCLTQLAAAINSVPGEQARFTPLQLKDVARSPRWRRWPERGWGKRTGGRAR